LEIKTVRLFYWSINPVKNEDLQYWRSSKAGGAYIITKGNEAEKPYPDGQEALTKVFGGIKTLKDILQNPSGLLRFTLVFPQLRHQ